ncbi:MAG: hypothetical protein R6X12_04650 [bacterium]
MASALVVLGLAAPAAGQWRTVGTDTVSATDLNRWLSTRSLALDDAGRLHAAWSEAVSSGVRRLLYAARDSGRWSEPETVAVDAGGSPVIAVAARSGRPHLAWPAGSGPESELWYAERGDSGWQAVRLTDNSDYDISPSIELEGDSLPHIAWITVDAAGQYRIGYATRRDGDWQDQVLAGSQLGPFGLGAAPWLAIEPGGRAHVSYRGGTYGSYHVHHAANASPGDTTWSYETIYSLNLEDYLSGISAGDSGELYLVVSGNDGWGMPWRTCFFHRPAGATNWDPVELMTSTASAALQGFCREGRFIHITWERIDGNIATEEIYHCSNASGYWYSSALRADGLSYGGALAVGPDRAGHCLLLSGPVPNTRPLLCLHSEPFTGALEPAAHDHGPVARATLARAPVRLAGLVPAPATLFTAAGRRVTRLGSDGWWDGRDAAGRAAPPGGYVLRGADGSTRAFTFVR